MSEGEYQASLADPWWDNGVDDYWELQSRVASGFWQVSSGALIKISEMSDSHLRNAIAWAEQNGYDGSGKLSELRTELEARS